MTNKISIFREDINGLRAISVISVVFFHFLPNKLPGGFIGVDVFFVISGFLMTSIIFRGLDNKNFSYINFIISRAKRIVPALLALSILLLIAGYFTLRPDPYKILSEHIKDSLFFISNITYEKESGYFDTESVTKFLLHTWSLSVEWQFYLIYPLILIFLKRFMSISKLKIAVIIILALSLTLSIIITKYNSDKAYFMFYTRAWEMLFGGIAFLYPFKISNARFRFYLEMLGLSLILSSVILFSPKIEWPGYAALLPVIGAYLCISADNKQTILSGYIINKIGLWSYSMYLVHWPIITFNHILGWNLSFAKYISIVFILSFLLYELIEKRRNYNFLLPIFFTLAVLSSLLVIKSDGFKSRMEIPGRSQESLTHGMIDWKSNQWLAYNFDKNKNESIDFIFYGDSFTSHYTHYISNQKKSVAILYYNSCFSTPNYYSHTEECRQTYSLLKDGIKNNPSKTLVMAQAWTHDQQNLRLRSGGEKLDTSLDEYLSIIFKEISLMKDDLGLDKIVLIGINNHFVGGSPKECLEKKFSSTIYERYFDKKQCLDAVPLNTSEYVGEFNKAMAKLSDEYAWIDFINPTDAECKNGMCMQFDDGLSLYTDRSHFSVHGSNIVGKSIFDKLESPRE